MPDIARWAFTSPWRLALIVLLPLAVWVMVDATGSSTGNAEGTTRPAVAAPTNAEEVPARAGPEVPPRALPVEAEATASGFLAAWRDGDRPRAAWLASVSPFVSPSLRDGLALTDPQRVPAAAVARTRAEAVGDHAAVLAVELVDGRELALELAHDGSAWRVTDIRPSG